MQQVQAKFRCVEIKHAHTGDPKRSAATIIMVPVWEENGVNREWSQATPSGKLEMLITNPAAIARYELGKSYVLHFVPATD